jgi:hypothetical protein
MVKEYCIMVNNYNYEGIDMTLLSGCIRCNKRCWIKEGAGLTNLLTMYCAHWVHRGSGLSKDGLKSRDCI